MVVKQPELASWDHCQLSFKEDAEQMEGIKVGNKNGVLEVVHFVNVSKSMEKIRLISC